MWYAEVNDSVLNQPTVDLCGEGCAQLDDVKWFLPTERAGDLSAPESEIKTSDSESGVDFIEPVSTPLQGGRRSPAVACWTSDNWVASSNPLRGKFGH